MTKSKTTKRALLSSCVALMLCFSMLLGTTYAWFTDEVTSSNNIIKSGTLDVEMAWSEDLNTWTDAAEGAIFDYQYWEPGYTEIRYVKVSNVGNLAFKYKLNIIPNMIVAEDEFDLADVIDVYMIPDVTAPIARADIAGLTSVGTMSSLMADPDGAARGVLIPKAENRSPNFVMPAEAYEKESFTVAIALKMQEDAGNDYQNLSVGEGFSVQLLATQYTAEEDSFDHWYDEGAEYDELPRANVKETGAKLVMTSTHGEIMANTTFQFLPTETAEEGAASPYAKWHADFVVYADEDIPANAVILPGYYSAYCDGYNNGKWVGMSSDQDIAAGTEIRLVDSLAGLLGGTVTVNYEEICKWGNDNVGFLCGVSDQSYGALEGTTLTVELRVYETYTADEAYEKFGDHSTNYEKADYETDGKDYYATIGTYTYTFGGWDGTSTKTPEYDDATGAYMINNAAELAGFAKSVNVDGNKYSGKTVMLNADIDLENCPWTPIGQTGATEFRGVFDGQGYTIYNLNIDSSAHTDEHYSSGLFGWAESGVTIKNVKVDGATVKGNHNVAVICGYTYSGKISNCHVTNANIVCTHANDDACGDKCGLIAGYAGDESRFTDCSGSDSTVKAGRDAGQLIGCGYNVSVSNCTATNVTVTAGGDCTGANINAAIIGRVMG